MIPPVEGMMDALAQIRVHVSVSGRVQGVWFRRSTQEEAERLGLRGWVRNRRDGTVEWVAEGSAASVRALVAWSRRGPPLAQVSSVEITEDDVVGLPAGFSVRPTA